MAIMASPLCHLQGIYGNSIKAKELQMAENVNSPANNVPNND